MPDVWPYGNDLEKPSKWVGMSKTLSRRYNIAYISGTRFGLFAHHTFLFYAYEAFAIGIFRFKSWGLHGSPRAWKIFQRRKFNIRQKKDSDSGMDLSDKAGKIQDTLEEMRWDDILTMEDQYAKAKILYDIAMEEGTPVSFEKPFSLVSLAGCRGGLAGAELELIAKFAYYNISADGKFNNVHVLNFDSGFVGGSMDESMWGYWEPVDNYMNLYEILPKDLDIYDHKNPNYNMRPYSRYVRSPDYFRYLPPLVSTVPIGDDSLRNGQFYRQKEMSLKQK